MCLHVCACMRELYRLAFLLQARKPQRRDTMAFNRNTLPLSPLLIAGFNHRALSTPWFVLQGCVSSFVVVPDASITIHLNSTK